MRDLDRWIEAGAVVKPHGVRGEVIVDLRRDLLDEVHPGCELRAVGRDGTEETLRIVDARDHQGRLIVRFDGLETRDDADRLRSRTLWIDREAIGPRGPDCWFVQDIIGMEVRTDDGELLGRVTDVMHTPANDVYIVRGGGGEILLPAIEDVLKTVDVEEGLMIVHLIEGLR